MGRKSLGLPLAGDWWEGMRDSVRYVTIKTVLSLKMFLLFSVSSDDRYGFFASQDPCVFDLNNKRLHYQRIFLTFTYGSGFLPIRIRFRTQENSPIRFRAKGPGSETLLFATILSYVWSEGPGV